jgi:hypothetical protein
VKTEQLNIFGGKRKLIGAAPSDSLLKECHEIVQHAIIDSNPYAICLMLSGGDDSVTALEVALMLGVHKFSYHLLKVNPFDKAISKYIRQGKLGRNIILLNGVRVDESDNRADNFGDTTFRWQKKNNWVNIIHWLTKPQCLDILSDQGIERNPVSIALGRSGECNFGTMQSEADRMAASEFDPAWGEWMQRLRKEITLKFGWDIGQNPNKKALEAIKAEAQKLTEFMPMCIGCKANQYKLFHHD